MMKTDVTLSEERIVLELRSLYCRYGYVPFRMSNFEEYDLYVRNKDFLVSDSVIAFSDTNGRMLALKPDVTFSIIKSGEDRPLTKQKVCYNENVYRVSDTTHRFREIMQSGLECIGDIGIYDVYEVIDLAAKSLSLINNDFIIEVSCLDVISSVLQKSCTDEAFGKKALNFISKKNRHDLERLCAEFGLSSDRTEKICCLVGVYGDRQKVIDEMEKISECSDIGKMKELSNLLDCSEFSDKIVFDFSVVNDMDYYNGFVFRGFIKGLSSGVLSGGQYDRMMARLGRTSGAIGFAVYMDKLESLFCDEPYQPDLVVLYDESVGKSNLISVVKKYTEQGLSVSVQKMCDDSYCGKVLDMRREGVDA